MSKIKMITFILIIIVILLLFHIYPTLRALSWAGILNQINLSVTVLYSIATIISFFLWKKNLSKIIYYQFGFISLLFFIVLFADFFWLIGIRKLITSNVYYKIVLIITVLLFIIAIYNFHKPFTIKMIKLKSAKITREYKFLHISDIHFGSINKKELMKLLKTLNNILNSNKIDSLLFTGDAIDTDIFSITDFEGFDFTNFPKLVKYFVTGNHDMGSTLMNIINIMNKLGYIVLRDEASYLNSEIDVIGFDDHFSKQDNSLKHKLATMDINKNKYNILMYHRPVDAELAEKNYIDLMISGHTHGGQIFPYNLIFKLIHKYPQGLVKVGKMFLYTSDGTFLWGPKMRLGSSNEIALITIESENKSNQSII